jgi:parvulin-like peptidyl-prolyl isomerase
LAGLFGREFPRKLSALPVGRWVGPVESGYGLHLVLIRERTPGRVPALAEVRDAVEREWRAVRRQELKAELRRRLRARYAVVVQWPDWASEAAKVGGAGPQKRPP